jgi:outer membrane scaffolding protein for murein synthesis (MipA/OmpV family)
MAAGHEISKRWRIGGTLKYKRLVGDAAGSPIVDDNNQYFAGFELSYHLGAKIQQANHQ